MKKIGGVFVVLGMVLGATAHAEVVATARCPEGAFAEFRVVLDAVGAPVAVANFMGLVDGSQAWVDPETRAVREGAGDAFYKGMVFDWNTGDMVRGGLRAVAGTNGAVQYTGGTGYTAMGKGEHSRDAVSVGSLILPEEGGPHSGGGEIALALTNGTTPWTVFGQVKAGEEAGLRELAEAVTGGATEVEWSVDASGATAEERAALEKGRAALAAVRGIRTRLDGAGPEWELDGKSLLGISTTADPAGGWTFQWGMWNEGDEATGLAVGWDGLGMGDGRGFASFLEVTHPKLTGKPFSGKWRIGVEHSAQRMQYWLDFDGGTGMWAVVESGAVTDSGRISGIRSWRETGNSVFVFFGMGLTANYYYFGFAEEGAMEGRFMSKQQYTAWTEDWGRFEMAEGWDAAAEKAVRRSGRRREGVPPVLGVPVKEKAKSGP